jgi:hypothetical protein
MINGFVPNCLLNALNRPGFILECKVVPVIPYSPQGGASK